MKEAILKKINNKLTELFGENVSQNVFDRVNEEIRFFEEKGLTDFIYNLSDYLKNLLEMLGQNNAFHVRQEAGYSLVLYLLGINDLNPLPLYKHKHKEYGLQGEKDRAR